MSEASSIPQWLHQLQQGDAAAMQRLWDVFFSRLMGSAERHLQFVSPQKVEGEDVVASVFESIWGAAQAGRLQNVTDVDELLWILLAMTRRKCIDHVRRAQAERRGGPHQPVSLDSPATLFAEIVSADPDPRYLVDLNDEHQRILGKLSGTILKEIAVLKIEGYRIDEIARHMGVAETTVRRKLKIIRQVYRVELGHG